MSACIQPGKTTTQEADMQFTQLQIDVVYVSDLELTRGLGLMFFAISTTRLS